MIIECKNCYWYFTCNVNPTSCPRCLGNPYNIRGKYPDKEHVERWCLTHGHWWYPHEQQKQAPKGYCYCCAKKQEKCKCEIDELVGGGPIRIR